MLQDYSITKLNTWSAYYFILYTFLHGLAVLKCSAFLKISFKSTMAKHYIEWYVHRTRMTFHWAAVVLVDILFHKT